MDHKTVKILSEYRPTMQSPDFILLKSCKDHPILTWFDFTCLVEKRRIELLQDSSKNFILYDDSTLSFIASLLALLYSQKQIHLPGSMESAKILSKTTAIKFYETDILLSSKFESINYLEYNKIDISELRLIFHTSGSTGEPKQIFKNLHSIETELSTLMDLWGSHYKHRLMVTSVGHQHFYGFLFSALLPLTAQSHFYHERIQYPETIMNNMFSNSVFITSPAFLKRCTSNNAISSEDCDFISLLISSGGNLPIELAEASKALFTIDVTEIYGSTETGGIAWRENPSNPRWNCFRDINIQVSSEGLLGIQSPYLDNSQTYWTNDLITMHSNGSFSLQGRSDSIVKIEEKRVSLVEVEMLLFKTTWVQDCTVIAMEDQRQYLAAALVLNDLGKEYFRDCNKAKINKGFHMALAQDLYPTVVPRKWRFVDELPRNAQGKLTKKDVLALFEHHDTVIEPIIIAQEKQENVLITDLEFPKTLKYFQGHFLDNPILPAVAQIDLIMQLARRNFNVPFAILGLPRIKFMHPITPADHVRIHLDLNEANNSINFKFASTDGSIHFSSGRIKLSPR